MTWLRKRGCAQNKSLDRIEDVSNRYLTQHASDTGTLKNATTTTNDKLQHIGTTLQASNLGTQQLLEQVSDKVQNLSGMSSGQSETLNAILNLLRTQVTEKPSSSVEEMSRKFDAMEEHKVEVGREREVLDGEEDGIMECLGRLCQLATETNETIFSEDAEAIIRDLECLLDSLSKVEDVSNEAQHRGKRKRQEGHSDDAASQHGNDLKRMKSFLTSSQSIALNGRSTNPVTHPRVQVSANRVLSVSANARQAWRIQIDE